jgi:hypothetical protein
VLAAWRFGGWFDRALMGFSVIGFSVPVFVLAYLLIWFVSLRLGLLPVQGYHRLADGFWPYLEHLLLPSITLSIIFIALIARVTRASVLEALGEDYIRTARAKGLPEMRVLLRHALANAAVPIVTVIGLGIAVLIGGVVVTESVYAIPGLGRLTVDAVLARDFPDDPGCHSFLLLRVRARSICWSTSRTCSSTRGSATDGRARPEAIRSAFGRVRGGPPPGRRLATRAAQLVGAPRRDRARDPRRRRARRAAARHRRSCLFRRRKP